MGDTTVELIVNAIKIAVIFISIVSTVPLLVWVERRGGAFIQNRLGPNRVGPLGLLQLAADAVKFIFKEEFIPDRAEKVLYFMAPGLCLLPSALTFAAIPMGSPIEILGFTIPLQIANLDVGLIYILGVASLGVYGVLAAGWSSGNKFALMGAMRAASQMISYEIALGVSLIGVLLIFNTFDLNQIVALQSGPLSFGFFGNPVVISFLPNWGIFYQPLAFLLFLTAAFAETNRLPFDLPEGESEIVAGFHTEYGGFKFNMFFMAEYGHMITSSALIATLFFGGFGLPFVTDGALREFFNSQYQALSFIPLAQADLVSVLTAVTYLLSFIIKTGFWLFFFIWIRWSLPRFRYDQLMDLGWKTMLPWGLVNIVVTAIMVFYSQYKAV